MTSQPNAALGCHTPLEVRVIGASGPIEIGERVDRSQLPRCTALVMAANRNGPENSLARAAGVSHKCAVPVRGVPMLERVIRTLQQLDSVSKIIISAESREVLSDIPCVHRGLSAGELEFVPSGPNLAESVANAADTICESDYPLFITTADNVLLNETIFDDFYISAVAADVDAAFALTPRAVLEEAYPDQAPDIGHLTFTEGQHSNCNVYLFKTPAAVKAAQVMRQGGQFRSHPWRVLRAVGLRTLLFYKIGRLRLKRLCARLERLFGIRVGIVVLPHTEAAIDADNAESLALIERILRDQEASRHAA